MLKLAATILAATMMGAANFHSSILDTQGWGAQGVDFEALGLANLLDGAAIILTMAYMIKLLWSGSEIKFDLNRLIAAGIEKQCLSNQKVALAPRALLSRSLVGREASGEELLAA